MSEVARLIGRAGTVLVFGGNDSDRAVTSTVVAHTRDFNPGERIRFVGPVAFEDQTARHIKEMLIPIVDHLGESLGLAPKNFEISVVNPGATSLADLGVEICGFSADVPILLAMVSAVLNISIPDDLVTTGHIASSDGDIAAVKALPAKILAAQEQESIQHFVYPALDGDSSLTALSPIETEKAKIAVINARSKLKLTAVSNVADLAAAVLTDEAIVMASLQEGFFVVDGSQQAKGNPVSLVVRLLTENNQDRFWDVLERYLHTGESELAKRLLLARSQFHIRGRTYPREFGRDILQMLRSLPPAVRRLKIVFPLLPTRACIELSQYAAESDADDIRLLYNAAVGKEIWTECTAVKEANPGDRSADQADIATVDAIISQIDRAALARMFGTPIDTARATYMLDSLTVESSEQFFDCISAFYLHLQRHVHSPSESLDRNAVRSDAIDLFDKTFFNRGGLVAAMNEACQAVQGGMKFILDCMTEYYKTEGQNKYVNGVITEALSPMEPEAKISFIRVLLNRLSPHLPEDIVSAPPERFADHCDVFVKTYVESLDHINEAFRRY